MQNSEILLTIKLNQTLFADPKRIELLRQIAHSGSISQAAKLAGISYKSAWDHLDAMNKLSPKPLLERSTGGKQGGGTQLTAYAQRLLQLYNLLTQLQEKAFSILHQEDQPLDSLLVATAHASLQSSARNQFFGKVAQVRLEQGTALVDLQIPGLNQPLVAAITAKSCERLKLAEGKEVMAMVKAPWIEITDKACGENVFEGVIEGIENQEMLVKVGEVTFCGANQANLEAGQTVRIFLDPKQIILATLY
ncbi:molybdenum-dependent transcriptional regulator [Pasteurellaceae bacterium RH1A]|nr:molybdenum-dependent transcriptional regulator [Pasteurellaceae bacterium RH1A]